MSYISRLMSIYHCLTLRNTSYSKFLFKFSINANNSSLPNRFTAEERNICGSSFHVSNIFSRKASMFFGLYFLRSSVLVKTITKGTIISPNQLINSKSTSLGGMRLSISTKVHCKVGRLSKKSRINASHFLRCILETLA